MKKEFKQLNIEVVEINATDIITISFGNTYPGVKEESDLLSDYEEN